MYWMASVQEGLTVTARLLWETVNYICVALNHSSSLKRASQANVM